MIGNSITQQWVVTRNARDYPEVYVELTIHTSQPLTALAHDLLRQATVQLGVLGVELRRVEPRAAPEVAEANVVDVVDADSDPAAQRIGELRDDLRRLVELINDVTGHLEGGDAARLLYDRAGTLIKKYDL